MTKSLAGRYFLPRSARYISASATLKPDGMSVEDSTGSVLDAAPLDRVLVSERLGNLPRRFALPSGACFETDDNETADRMLKSRARRGSFIHRMERSWHWAAVSLLVAAFATYAFVVYGIPAAALALARETPPSANELIGRQALQVLDRVLLAPSELPARDNARAQRLFATVAALGDKGTDGYRLLLRAAPRLGPNALALPDGTIILTDELWALVTRDDEIQGVFAHEIAHVDRAHSLQRLYQAALVPAAIAVITGDLSQIGQVATVLPGVVVQAAYSRGLEQEADDISAAVLRRLGGNPSHMADLLERLESRLCGKGGCPPSWLGSHPDMAQRLLRLRSPAPAKATVPQP